MNEDFKKRLAAALEALEPDLDKSGSAPVPAAGEDPKRFLTYSDQLELRGKLKGLTRAELSGVLGKQMVKEGQGIPVDVWMRSGGGYAIEQLMQQNQIPHVAQQIREHKAIDEVLSRAKVVEEAS